MHLESLKTLDLSMFCECEKNFAKSVDATPYVLYNKSCQLTERLVDGV